LFIDVVHGVYSFGDSIFFTGVGL